jgi:hypothetical protein
MTVMTSQVDGRVSPSDLGAETVLERAGQWGARRPLWSVASRRRVEPVSRAHGVSALIVTLAHRLPVAMADEVRR